MANGRMINNAITKDVKINRLSDDTSRLAFTWTITFLDRDGRTYGDPAILRSMLFPRRDDITIAQMEAYIQEWHTLGMAVWYEAEGDKFLWFPNFAKNQVGMRPERESASIIPPCPAEVDTYMTELVQQYAGVSPDDSRNKLKEIKLKEKNRKESKEEEEDRKPPPELDFPTLASPDLLERIFTNVTGLITFPSGSRANDLERLEKIYRVQADKIEGYLQPFWVEWTGRNYSKSNTNWLDWAVAGQIPQRKAASGSGGKPSVADHNRAIADRIKAERAQQNGDN